MSCESSSTRRVWLALISALALGGCSAAVASAPRSTPESASSRHVTVDTHPLTPIRGHLYFTRTTAGDVQTIYLASGLREKQLTAPGEVCCILRKSPRQGRLLVMPGGDVEPPITGGTLNLNGGRFKRLKLTDPLLNLVPQAWSPDGVRIAFEGWDDTDPDRRGSTPPARPTERTWSE